MFSKRDFSSCVRKCRLATLVCGLSLILSVTAMATDPSAKMDFDGDGKTDLAVFRAGDRSVFPLQPSYFYILSSQTGQLITRQWGRAYDIHAPADYDGDGKTDVAIFRWLENDLTPSLSHFWIGNSLGGHVVVPFSGFGNITSRNYFGDRKAEIGVFDRYDISENPIDPCFIWAFYIKAEGTDFALRKDVTNDCQPDNEYLTPAVYDFNNDGITDIALFAQSRAGSPRLSEFRLWFSPVLPQYTAPAFTMPFDIDYPIPGDYDGDGWGDIAGSKYVNGVHLWRIRKSTTGEVVEKYFGFTDDYPVPGDYDGDGKTDIAVFRPSNGAWYITRSSDGAFTYQVFGLPTDIPVTMPNSNVYF